MKTRNYSISRFPRENFFHLNEITSRCYKDVLSIAMSCKSSIKCLTASQRCKTSELLIILDALLSKHSSTRCFYSRLFHCNLSGFVVTFDIRTEMVQFDGLETWKWMKYDNSVHGLAFTDNSLSTYPSRLSVWEFHLLRLRRKHVCFPFRQDSIYFSALDMDDLFTV